MRSRRRRACLSLERQRVRAVKERVRIVRAAAKVGRDLAARAEAWIERARPLGASNRENKKRRQEGEQGKGPRCSAPSGPARRREGRQLFYATSCRVLPLSRHADLPPFD